MKDGAPHVERINKGPRLARAPSAPTTRATRALQAPHTTGGPLAHAHFRVEGQVDSSG